ncbi:MAG: hypothetical protein WC726_00090 [Parcubacteria group bacterium]|jgi:hypothetical protein
MKKIQDIFKRRIFRAKSGHLPSKALDEKTIARVFLEAAKEEIKNLEDADIREIKIKDPPASSREASRAGKILYIKTAHPVISSELFLRRETILEKTNDIAGKKVVEKILIG